MAGWFFKAMTSYFIVMTIIQQNYIMTLICIKRDMIRMCNVPVTVLIASCICIGSQVAPASEKSEWKDCLYNGESLPCRRTFLCGNAQPPCYSFKIEWKDGVSDIYTRDQAKISHSRNIGYYQDPRGGIWEVIGHADSTFIVNSKDQNTIIYNMTAESCLKVDQWNYLCPKQK